MARKLAEDNPHHKSVEAEQAFESQIFDFIQTLHSRGTALRHRGVSHARSLYGETAMPYQGYNRRN